MGINIVFFIFTCALTGTLAASLLPKDVHTGAFPGVDERSDNYLGGSPFSVYIQFKDESGTAVKTCNGIDVKYAPTNGVVEYYYAYILTTADCFIEVEDKTQYKVAVNDDYVYGYGSLQYRIHPKYDKATKQNNIGFIYHRTRPRRPNQLAKIPEVNDDFTGKVMEIGTIGDIFGDGQLMLKHRSYGQPINTTVISSFWCRLAYPFSPLSGASVCTSGWFRKGLTEIDTAASLAYKKSDGTYILAGIATYIRPWTSQWSLPIEFTSVIPYARWIKYEVKQIHSSSSQL